MLQYESSGNTFLEKPVFSNENDALASFKHPFPFSVMLFTKDKQISNTNLKENT